MTEVNKDANKAIDENKTIYFEKEMAEAEIQKPDAQNFVKLEPTTDDVNTNHPIENKLRFIVPPAVRAMQQEIQQLLQEVVNHNFEVINKGESDQVAFLK